MSEQGTWQYMSTLVRQPHKYTNACCLPSCAALTGDDGKI
jgi:hypothetical protein